MFETFENRQRSNRSSWKAFGVVAVLFAAGAWLFLHFWEAHEESVIHERYLDSFGVHARRNDGKPRTIDLPGMSVVAPGLADQTGDYEHGSLMGTIPIEFAVQWFRVNTIPRERIVDIVIGSFQKSYNWKLARAFAKELHLVGLEAHEDTLGTPDGALAIVTQLECGKRQVTLMAAGTQADVRKINDAMVASFRCNPDPDIDLDRPPVVVDAVKGWTRWAASHSSNMLELEGPHGEILHAAKLGPREGSVADVITGLIDNTAIQLTSKPTTRNDKVFWQGINAPDHKPAAILAWRCADDRVAFITIIAPKSVDDAVAVADTGRCLTDGDAVPLY